MANRGHDCDRLASLGRIGPLLATLTDWCAGVAKWVRAHALRRIFNEGPGRRAQDRPQFDQPGLAGPLDHDRDRVDRRFAQDRQRPAGRDRPRSRSARAGRLPSAGTLAALDGQRAGRPIRLIDIQRDSKMAGRHAPRDPSGNNGFRRPAEGHRRAGDGGRSTPYMTNSKKEDVSRPTSHLASFPSLRPVAPDSVVSRPGRACGLSRSGRRIEDCVAVAVLSLGFMLLGLGLWFASKRLSVAVP
jgi:hypothetical protein